jgi:hypothetical protein
MVDRIADGLQLHRIKPVICCCVDSESRCAERENVLGLIPLSLDVKRDYYLKVL